MSAKIQPFSLALHEQHQKVLQYADQLDVAINNLFYEGKVHQGRNMKKIEEVIHYFQDELLPHMQMDEERLFPYAAAHFPQLEPMVAFLNGEQNEIRDRFLKFRDLFARFQIEDNKRKRDACRDQLREKGTYLFCLIRSHIQTENESVYKALFHELDSEKINNLEKHLRP